MKRQKRKLYLDTSILGFSLHKTNPPRRAEANLLLRQIREKHFVAGYSFVTMAEISAAPPRVAQRLRRKIVSAGLRSIRVRSRDVVYELAQRYCRAGIIPKEFFDDALYVAIATLWRADALVSFNFTHLVRLDTMTEVNAINQGEGFATIFLCQPSEVILR